MDRLTIEQITHIKTLAGICVYELHDGPKATILGLAEQLLDTMRENERLREAAEIGLDCARYGEEQLFKPQGKEWTNRKMIEDRLQPPKARDTSAYDPKNHARDCDFHLDQYPQECSCGYTSKTTE